MEQKTTISGEFFVETQSFRQWWLFVLLLPIIAGSIVFICYSSWTQLLMGKPIGDRPMPDLLLVFFIVIVALSGLVIPLGVLFARLVVRVDAIKLDISFWPLARKAVPISEIVSFEATDYKALREYGGWGIKRGKDGRWAYNVSGNRGVFIDLADGRKWLIGSQRAEELAEAISRAKGESG
ncbi:MAG: hypothetical protein GY802_20475 [Gammaproteobacteria bacterium]|nr:hypothetical protein [Gammaproteobacteria bacterium]